MDSDAVDTSRAVWLQTNFFVGSDPDKPETFIKWPWANGIPSTV